ncbi:DNA gyrase inhibitor YacG [Celeribacter halophilus]|uniref:DNA gyrase inhibitor YacG n=1 Tax=Celeribacter halophilus TaxID=576117 RepID=UPI001C091A9D|nr:DNA gyrase inhibitor YacG [Celeribacter halophilus]MBU2888448.1 DNA gyrase inhibitor YacG [Celeribacter halophilus]MDO6509198.1 DNA gyrase inhibitor YacG [Celeribacter halophilus]
MSCPICGGESIQKYRPFCSKRCADVDLGHWMNGAYAVPSGREEVPEEIANAIEEALRDEFEATGKKPH